MQKTNNITKITGWAVSVILAGLRAYDVTRPKWGSFEMMMMGVTTVYIWMAAVITGLAFGACFEHGKYLYNKHFKKQKVMEYTNEQLLDIIATTLADTEGIDENNRDVVELALFNQTESLVGTRPVKH